MVKLGWFGSMRAASSCGLATEAGHLFFKPLQLGISNTNNPVELVKLSLGGTGCTATALLSFVREGLWQNGFGSIPPLHDLAGMYLVQGSHLVNGFVTSHCC